MTDCLIAPVAIRTGTTMLHNDADFEVLARHTELRVYVADGVDYARTNRDFRLTGLVGQW